MRRNLNRPSVWIAAVLALVCVTLIAVLVVRAEAEDDQPEITVMTRNLYIGADITRPLRAADGRTGQQALLDLGHANHELRQTVDRTSFAVRGQLLAAEIVATRPDLIGLQEVALWRHGPLQLEQLGQLNAEDVKYDFLAILLADLDQRGVGYEVVQVQQESDVEAPAFTGNPFTGTAGAARDVRLTVRDVILMRQGSGIRVTGTGGAQYGQVLRVDLAGVPFSFVRGYAWADAVVGASRLRFVTTHLESQNDDVATSQARELLGALAADSKETTIIACDCNAAPGRPRAGRGELSAPPTTYQVLTSDRFTDLWLQQPKSAGAGRGDTAGLSERVNDPTASSFTRRLDLVLARPSDSGRVTVIRGEVTGNELTDRDSRSGLWPSDHAGVVLQLGLY